MNNIKVSVVTVCFNSVKTIEKTIQSVLYQSYKNLEYIIIDGGSTDGTIDIIKKYEDNIDYWVSEPDDGIYDAMNKGIKKATGDVIGFINSDDWYEDNAISVIAKTFSQIDTDIVYGNLLVVCENGTIRLFKRYRINDICCGRMAFGHPSTFVKMEHMKRYMFNCSYRIAADYAFLLEMYLQGKRFYGIDAIIAHFREGGASSHPWKSYMEAKTGALRLACGRVSGERYIEIREEIKKSRYLPIFRFLCNRIALKLREKPYEEMFSPFAKRDFVLYGAGVFGMEVLRFMRKLGFHIISFWDSDRKKQGEHLEGIPILYPIKKIRNSKEVIILVTVAEDGGGIAEMLEDFGYEHKREFFDKDDWIGWIARIWLHDKRG